MKRVDVVVIGAGLAGLWCARSLGRRNIRVLLVDAKASVDARVQTTGIFVRRTFEDFELPPGALGQPIRRVVLYSPHRRAISLESRRDEFRVADMRMLYSALLNDCVRHGVIWSPRTRYRGSRCCGEMTSVDLGTHRVQASFVVGADGPRSQVAEDLGLSRNRSFIVGLEDVYESVEQADPPSLHCILDPVLAPGYIAWVVHDGTAAHVGTGGDPRRFHAQRALDRFSIEAARMIDLGSARWVERRGGSMPVNGILPNIASERGLLVGDAAGAPSPLTAGGLDPCIRLSDFAAVVLAKSIASNTSKPLEAYNGRQFSARFAVRRWARATLEWANPMALNLACAAMRNPLAHNVAEHIFFGSGSFPDPYRLQRRPQALTRGCAARSIL